MQFVFSNISHFHGGRDLLKKNAYFFVKNHDFFHELWSLNKLLYFFGLLHTCFISN